VSGTPSQQTAAHRPEPSSQKDITVVGIRDPQAEAALAVCLKSGCSPATDVNASLRIANAQFVAGKYDDAHGTLRKALERARRGGAEHPRLIAALYQAQATIAQHRGDTAEAIGENRRAVFALVHGEGQASVDALAAQIDLGNALAQAGKKFEAQQAYRMVAQAARSSGQKNMAYVADILQAWLDYRTGEQALGKAKLTKISQLDDADLYLARISAATLLARIGREHNDPQPTERLIALLTQEKRLPSPLLVYAAPLNPPRTRSMFLPTLNRVEMVDWSDRESNEWVDIGYWIRPAGNVDQVQVLRGSKERYWIKPNIALLESRRYTPITDGNDGIGTYHVIRLSLGYPLSTPSDSHIPRRMGQPIISEMDLAKSDWPSPPTSDG
jgi:hypothetical protein